MVAAIAVTGLLGACSGGDKPPAPVLPAGASVVAFTFGEGGFALQELGPDGAAESSWSVPEIGRGFRVSPDGRTAGWVRPSDPKAAATLVLLDLDTGELKEAPTSAAAMEWLPDGRMIGLDVSSPPGTIGLLDPGGQLTPTGRLQQPAVGPRRFSDTELLVFERLAVPGGEGAQIAGGWPVVVSLDGRTRMTIAPPDGCFAAGASASPDQTQITMAAVCEDETDNGLYLASSDGQRSARLIGGNVLSPSWSPDGSTVAYLRQEDAIDPERPEFAGAVVASTIWVVDVDSGETDQLSPDGTPYLSPGWRPGA